MLKSSRGLRSNIIIIDGIMYATPVEIINCFGDKTISCSNCLTPIHLINYGRGSMKSAIPTICKCGAKFNWVAFIDGDNR